MKLYYCILIILFGILAKNALSQSWKVDWNNQLGNNKMDFFTDVIENRDGGFIVLGSTLVTGRSYDFWLVSYSIGGDTIWTKTLGTEARDIPKKVIQLLDGGFLLIGTCLNEDMNELILMRTDDKGEELWKKVFANGISYSGEDVVPTQDQCFVLVGSKADKINNEKLWMTKIDVEGNLVWEKTYENNLNGSFRSIKKIPVGGYAIAGNVYEDNRQISDILLVRTNDIGDAEWITRIESSNTKEWPQCVCCSTDSCFMVVGWKGTCLNDINSADPIFDYDLVINKIDQSGNVVWEKNIDREGSEGGNAVTIRPDGNFIVAGIKATSFLGKVGPWLLHIDEDGNEISENLIKFHFNQDQAIKVINCTDGGFVVIGPGAQQDSNTRSDGWIMKFAGI